MCTPSLSARQSTIAQNDTLDMIATGQIEASKKPRTTALSLQMGPTILFANAINEPNARSIVAEWKPSYRITVMPAAEFDELSTRCSTTFYGQDSDLSEAANA